MKKHFITGLVLLLPLAMTIAIVLFIVNFFTSPFVDLVRGIFEKYGLLQHGFLFFTADQLQVYVGKILVLASLFLFTVLLGALARWVIIHYFIRLSDYIFHRIPIVRTIYKTTQDVINTMFGPSTKSFKEVVLVPFPNPQTSSLALVTKEDISIALNDKDEKLIAVFLPTTPNPTSGFLMMFRPEDVTYLDISVEDAFKYIISCGVVGAPFRRIPRPENPE